MFDLLLSWKGDSKEFMEYAEKKIKEYTDEANKIQSIDKKDNEGNSTNQGARAEGVR